MTDRLSRLLTEALVHGDGLNDFLHRFLGGVGEVLGIERLVLFDYDEHTDTFDLLYFRGFPSNARAELRRSLRSLDVRHALVNHAPYPTDVDEERWIVPLYFQETLEAVLLLESPGKALAYDDEMRDGLRLVSRFLGLFMSSSRLSVNQRKDLFDTTTALERAREVQMAYLPADCSLAERYEIFGYNQSAALVGGDYFDYFCRRQRTLQFVVADACGHGMAAALTVCSFRDLLHAEARRGAELDTLFDDVNRKIYCAAGQLRYLTALFFDYDEGRGELRYFNAGHHKPLLVRATGEHEWLPGGGLPLGMFEDAEYRLGSCRIGPGDLLVLFTDGIVDLQNRDDEFFGIEGVCDGVLDQRERPLRDLVRSVLGYAERFSNSPEPEDDLTLFAVRFR